MGAFRTFGATVRGLYRATRAVARGGVRFTRKRVGKARERGGGGDKGMVRLLDLHAASCAGDTLVAIGLAGTIFFNVPVDQARGQVALYLLVTMAPFALLAPLVGPLLDRFRHGRRWALAVTMLGRAFLVWVASDNLDTFGLYPTAFGVLLLSRAYGVARSAALPRLLPKTLSLVEAGARASLFGTVAGAVIVPIGVAASLIGSQWTLRLATVVFAIGMVWALRLPPRADSEPPESVPRIFQLPGHKTARVLTGRLVWASLFGSAVLRACYGFLALYIAFRARTGDFEVHGLPQQTALGVAAGALAIGTFTATAAFTRISIRRPLLLQAGVLGATAVAAAAATAFYGLWTAAALCLIAATASGAAKLAVDAVIQERAPQEVRASAFAHSETLLIIAWVLGGAAGLVPFAGNGDIGIGLLAVGVLLACVRTGIWARRLRAEKLTGHDPHVSTQDSVPSPSALPEAPPTTSGEEATPPGYHLYRPGKRSKAEDYPDNP